MQEEGAGSHGRGAAASRMRSGRNLPDDPLRFIQACVASRRVHWTYHVNMRFKGRFIPRKSILDAVGSYEMVEAYPQDKYLASYLVLARSAGEVFHVLFATDVEGGNVRIVTVYRPSAEEWEDDLKTRRTRR